MPEECEKNEPMQQLEARLTNSSFNSELSVKVYKEPRLELLKNWEVNIKVLTVGCIITVGCKAFAFTSIEEGLKELQEYYKDPSAARAKWSEIENKLNHVN